MGFFSSLLGIGDQKPTNVEVVTDRIWMTIDAKIAGLGKEVSQRSKTETVAILLVAHFPDVLARLGELVDSQTVEVPVMAVLASDLSAEIASNLNLGESATIDIIVGERHPLLSADEGLERFAAELPCHCRLSHHLSLEDAVMKNFGGDWVQSLLEKLGMTEDEAIESTMVSRRIKQAQEKVEGQIRGNSPADSSAQWMKLNCPEGGRK